MTDRVGSGKENSRVVDDGTPDIGGDMGNRKNSRRKGRKWLGLEISPNPEQTERGVASFKWR
jgi:hypothetical protein